VKQAMLRDLGARDSEFLSSVRFIQKRLLHLGGGRQGEYEAIIMQGSGTYGLEAVVASTIPRDGGLLVLVNGSYGLRIATMSRYHGIETTTLSYPENRPPDPDDVRKMLKENHQITHVAFVHCETTSGILNPIEELSSIVNQEGRVFVVDAMSSFGAYDVNLENLGIHYLVSSPNKCLEGIPGFTYVLAHRDTLESTRGSARSLSLDLLDQLTYWEEHGQFRYTPPTHTLLAFRQALIELDQEGGVKGRAARYGNNHRTLIKGMREMGFREYVSPELQSYVITSFLYPDDPRFDGHDFYDRLSRKNQIIYQGKVTDQRCFRIGTIGRIYQHDVRVLLAMIQATLEEMGVGIKKDNRP
jgi:2-aminoethylphosphonate-pyruvate transaminase